MHRIYLVQSGDRAVTRAAPSQPDVFNDGHGFFEDVTEQSATGDRGYGIGVAAGDYDNDGAGGERVKEES